MFSKFLQPRVSDFPRKRLKDNLTPNVSAAKQNCTRSTGSHVSLGSVRVKLKCTLVQALRLCTGRTAHRGSRGIALLFLDHGTRRGWGVSVTPQPLFAPGKDPVPIVQEVGWAPGPDWTGKENLARTGIRSPDLPARSQSLHQMRYPAHVFQFTG